MRIENAKMRVLKWERVWNDDREEKNWESEREQWMIYAVIVSQAVEDTHGHNFFFGTIFQEN